ncbi:MAG TPA: MFS transporter [Vicinamibacterales bacterium]|nr:MFS transporter [Vicinamibacterales bacterium]
MSRRVVWLLAVTTAVIVANIYYAQPLLADMARAFGLSVPQIGAVAMLTQIGSATGMLLFVPLGDKYERRGLITTLLAAGVIALAAMASAPTVLTLCLASFAVGAATSNVHVVVPLAAHLAPAQQRGRVLGMVFGGLLIGVLLARTFSGLLGAAFGWRIVYWIASAMMLVLAVVIRMALPVNRPDHQISWTALMRSLGDLFRRYATVREAALLAFLMFFSFSALWTTLVFLLQTPPYHYGTAAAGWFGLLGAASASSAPIVGRLSDRYGPERSVLGAIVVTLAGYLVLLMAGRMMAGLVAAIILVDAAVQSGHVANQSRIYGLDPNARSRLNTIYMVAFMSGGAAGSYMGPLGLKLWGWAGFCAFPMVALSIALVVMLVSARGAASRVSQLAS